MTVDEIVDGLNGYLQNDGTADYVALIESLGLVGEIAGLVLGILVTVIMAGLPVVIAIEICYINFPVFQSGYNNLYHRLKGKASQIFGLTIRDACKSLELATTSEMGTSVNWIYFKMKCKSIFICVFLVAMVLGPGQFILAQAWNLVNGIVATIF